MSSIKMVALRKHPFGTGEREAGEEYEATPNESAILIALKWAEKAKEKPAKVEKAPVVETKVLKAEAKAETAPAKGTYQRRDLKAKD